MDMDTPTLFEITGALQRLTGCPLGPPRDTPAVLADLPLGPGGRTTLLIAMSSDGHSVEYGPEYGPEDGPEDGTTHRARVSLTPQTPEGRQHHSVAERIIASTVARTVGRRRDAAAVVDAIAGVPGLTVSPPPPMAPGDTRRAVALVSSDLHGTQVVVADTDEGDVALIVQSPYGTSRRTVGRSVRTPLDAGRTAATLLRLTRDPEPGVTW